MKSGIAILSCLVSFIQMLALETSLSAEAPYLPGTFRLVAEQSDDIDGAIEQAVATMTFVMRPFARRRLRKINTPYERMVIQSTADAVVIVADASTPIRTPSNGAPIPWRREDGEMFNVRGVWVGSVFEQTFASGTGRRVNRYTVSPDGQTLTMQVVITGGGLTVPMTYALVYRRVS